MTVDENDRIQVPPGNPAYTLRRVWLSEEEQQGYYLGFANDGLWPLCHIVFTRPIFRASDWEMYKAVNQKFADIVVAEARNERPIVLVQDYHFALLPRMVRAELPEATIITFWHIPWPNSEVFSICPWREQILDGLLGSSIVGFHIQFHCNNFTESVDRFLESRIEREHSSISYGGQTTLVHSYPISIEWPPAALEDQPSGGRMPAENLRAVRAAARHQAARGRRAHGLHEGHPRPLPGAGAAVRTASRMDRQDGVPADRRAQPRHAARLPAAARGMHELSSTRSTSATAATSYKPIIMLDEHHTQEDIYNVYRAADACVVSSLHDGMNLVAKEFVAARDDEQGVLHPQHLRRRLARIARGGDRQSLRRRPRWARRCARR